MKLMLSIYLFIGIMGVVLYHINYYYLNDYIWLLSVLLMVFGFSTFITKKDEYTKPKYFSERQENKALYQIIKH